MLIEVPDGHVYCRDEQFGPPWSAADPVLLIHGVADTSAAWFGWMPHLAASSLRILRPDLRGFGNSSVPPLGYRWTLGGLVADLIAVLDERDVQSAHVVGAKFGGTVALALGLAHPNRVRTITTLGSPVRGRSREGSTHAGTGGLNEPALLEGASDRIGEVGLRAWAVESGRARLGATASDDELRWWADAMASSDARVCREITSSLRDVDLLRELPSLLVPTLVITTDRSPLTSLDATRAWQHRIPDSELLVLRGDGFHVAASHAQTCAEQVTGFMARREAVWNRTGGAHGDRESVSPLRRGEMQ